MHIFPNGTARLYLVGEGGQSSFEIVFYNKLLTQYYKKFSIPQFFSLRPPFHPTEISIHDLANMLLNRFRIPKINASCPKIKTVTCCHVQKQIVLFYDTCSVALIGRVR